MPVTKFRSFEDARRALWLDRTDPTLFRRMIALWRRSRLLAPPLAIPRGVTRYRSIEEADADRLRLERERVRRLRESRERG